MIKKISGAVVNWLIEQQAINQNENKLFAYAVYSLLFGLAPVLIIMLLGLVLDMAYEGVLFAIPFMAIRKFSGGFHVKSPSVCAVTSTGVIAGAYGLINLVRICGKHWELSVVVLAAALCTCCLSPIDFDVRRLKPNEIRCFKAISRILSIITVGVYFILLLIKRYNVATPIGVGLIVVTFLQLPCLVKRASLSKKETPT